MNNWPRELCLKHSKVNLNNHRDFLKSRFLLPIRLTTLIVQSSISRPYLSQMAQLRDPTINGNPEESPAEPLRTYPLITCNPVKKLMTVAMVADKLTVSFQSSRTMLRLSEPKYIFHVKSQLCLTSCWLLNCSMQFVYLAFYCFPGIMRQKIQSFTKCRQNTMVSAFLAYDKCQIDEIFSCFRNLSF